MGEGSLWMRLLRSRCCPEAIVAADLLVGFEDGDRLAGVAGFEGVGGDHKGDAGAELFVERGAEVLWDANARAVGGGEGAGSLPALAREWELHPVEAVGVDFAEAVGGGFGDGAG